jgi:hypothetical protein
MSMLQLGIWFGCMGFGCMAHRIGRAAPHSAR